MAHASVKVNENTFFTDVHVNTNFRHMRDYKIVKRQQCQRTRSPPLRNIRQGHADAGECCLLEVARRERAQTGLFSINAANGQPRLGMTDGILNLLCHFIGNLMMPIFCECDIYHRKY